MKEIVYLLTNPAMPNYVKVGRTTNLEARLRSLDNTSTPLPFECVYAIEVEDSNKVEHLLHDGLGDYRTRKSREFFEVDPSRVIALMKLTEGKDVTPQTDVVEDNESQVALDKARKIRSKFNFEMVDIKPGTTLHYLRDENFTCKVISKNKIEFRGEEMSLSAAALILNNEVMGYTWSSIAGPYNWLLDGESLSDRRKRMEDEE